MTCRCGRTVDAEELAALTAIASAAATAPQAEPRRSTATIAAVAAGVVALAGVAGTFAWNARRSTATAPVAQSQPASASRDVLADAPSDAASAEPLITTSRSTLPPSTFEHAATPAGPAADASSNAAPSSASAPSPALEDLISRLTPAVVTVQAGSARGSGFFISPDTILTNVHVVGANVGVTIRRMDGTTTDARVDKAAPAYDIAVLKVANPVASQPVIRMGSASAARVGQEVIAIGTPLGFLQNTVSRGIVSGLREVDGSTLVQTDAAINPGNSGGPLMNRDGVAIGIIKSGYAGRDGLSFAVAIDHARAVLDGQPVPAAPVASTPSQYTPLAPAVPSPADQQRAEAARAYEQAVTQVARRADALDSRWASFKGSCYEGRIVGSFDREWFAFWDPRAMQGAVSPGCGLAFNEIRRAAYDIRNEVVGLSEAARRADIFPGVQRDVLRKYRLDYSGWDR